MPALRQQFAPASRSTLLSVAARASLAHQTRHSRLRVAGCGLLASLLAAGSAAAKPPVVVVRAEINERPVPVSAGQPLEAVAGDEVWFDLTASEGAPDRFYVTLDERQPGLKQIDTVDQGRRVRLLTRVGTYQVRFLVSNEDGFDERRQTVVVRCQELTPSPAPGPAPPPSPAPAPSPAPPTPAPNPHPPGDPFQIARTITDAARKIGDPAGALALAERAKDLAAQIRAGQITHPQDVVNAIAAELKKAGPKWAGLLTVCKTMLQMLLATGALSSDDVKQWAVLLDVIEHALRDATK
jgi:hypothetical protein